MNRHRYRGTGQAGAYSAQQLDMELDLRIPGGSYEEGRRACADDLATPLPHFDGATYEAPFDYTRLGRQMRLVFDFMRGGVWLTLGELEQQTGQPQASISARLRDFRKPKFGGFTVERRARGERADGLFEYRMARP